MTFIYSQPLMGLSLGLVEAGGGGSCIADRGGLFLVLSPVVAGVLLPDLKRFGNNSHQEQKIDPGFVVTHFIIIPQIDTCFSMVMLSWNKLVTSAKNDNFRCGCLVEQPIIIRLRHGAAV